MEINSSGYQNEALKHEDIINHSAASNKKNTEPIEVIDLTSEDEHLPETEVDIDDVSSMQKDVSVAAEFSSSESGCQLHSQRRKVPDQSLKIVHKVLDEIFEQKQVYAMPFMKTEFYTSILDVETGDMFPSNLFEIAKISFETDGLYNNCLHVFLSDLRRILDFNLNNSNPNDAKLKNIYYSAMKLKTEVENIVKKCRDQYPEEFGDSPMPFNMNSIQNETTDSANESDSIQMKRLTEILDGDPSYFITYLVNKYKLMKEEYIKKCEDGKMHSPSALQKKNLRISSNEDFKNFQSDDPVNICSEKYNDSVFENSAGENKELGEKAKCLPQNDSVTNEKMESEDASTSATKVEILKMETGFQSGKENESTKRKECFRNLDDITFNFPKKNRKSEDD